MRVRINHLRFPPWYRTVMGDRLSGWWGRELVGAADALGGRLAVARGAGAGSPAVAFRRRQGWRRGRRTRLHLLTGDRDHCSPVGGNEGGRLTRADRPRDPQEDAPRSRLETDAGPDRALQDG